MKILANSFYPWVRAAIRGHFHRTGERGVYDAWPVNREPIECTIPIQALRYSMNSVAEQARLWHKEKLNETSQDQNNSTGSHATMDM
jgi:hypothetical protein